MCQIRKLLRYNKDKISSQKTATTCVVIDLPKFDLARFNYILKNKNNLVSS